MRFFSLGIGLVAGFCGIYLGFRTFTNFRRMTHSELPIRDLIISSLIAGGAGTLLFLSTIIMVGFFDENYVWTAVRFFGAFVISIVPGIIIMLGSFVQALMITGYRGKILETLNKKNKTQ